MQHPPPTTQQIGDLAARYGPPLRAVLHLPDSTFSPLTKDDRTGEVCMVVRRRSGGLLAARKMYYPPGVHRLLTGGIDHGETIEDALCRETHEETGLETVIRRFLGVVNYTAVPGAPPLGFATYAFLLDETGGELRPQDEEEQIASFREVLPTDLPAMAQALEHLPAEYHPELEGQWRPWGMFRAAAHRLVHAALA
jgi:8-oxo-dGTP pyrophosphatase MutT (NUDIX family)